MTRTVRAIVAVSDPTAQMVEHFARAFQVTNDQALEVLIQMATAALEARDERAHYFARARTDEIKRGYDVILAAPRNGG